MERKNLATEVGSIIVFASALFTLCAMWTYVPTDPSLFSSTDAAAQNACGRVGAYLSSLILEVFGLGGFLVPASMFFIAAAIHKKEGSTRLIGTLGGMTVAVMAFTLFLSLQWKYWPYSGTMILTGGAFGAWSSDLLLIHFNTLGSKLISLAVFFVAVVLATPLSVVNWVAALLRVTSQWGNILVLRGGRLILTYLFYFAGVFGMKAAYAAGDVLQRSIESALTRARDRAKVLADLRQKREEIEFKTDLIQVEELPEPEQEAAPARYEVPNALPELEQQNDAAHRQKVGTAFSEPEILPFEQFQLAGMTPPVESKEAVQRAMKKLAKSAARVSKRGNWKLPPVEFLRKPPKSDSQIDREKLLQNSQILKQKFADFGIDGEVTAVRPGPVITLYEFKPGPGVKVSRIASLADDLSMALSAQSVRILAPLPGKSVVGIEIPSDKRETVYLREFLQHEDFHGARHDIPVVMGKDIGGQTYLSDLARMPHLLCAGQTGSGKSVFMNGLICSLLYRFTPDELRLILVDPKFIEFRSYQDIPHLLLPVVDDPKAASTALKWAVREMERRYRILAMMGARNLAGFNQKVEDMGIDVVRDLLLAEENQQESVQMTSGGDWIEAFEPDESGAPRIGKLPNIVIIIDELADLMMVAKKEVEVSIARIAQKARAAGIHLVIATQRPSTDVVTGLIKANLPSRASFSLASYIDSKTILDRAGAERLLGQGDMLFIPPGTSQILRLHGAFVNDDEINKITAFLRDQGKPAYRDEILVDEEEESSGAGADDDDVLMQEAVELVRHAGHASASFLQRHLKVGYNRAARMIETMEYRGVVGPAEGSKPRTVLIR